MTSVLRKKECYKCKKIKICSLVTFKYDKWICDKCKKRDFLR